MPQQQDPNEPLERRDADLDRPMNPPNSVVRPAVRRAAVFTYVGALVAMFAIVGATLLFWAGRDDGFGSDTYGPGHEPSALGTSGERMPREGAPGGFDPNPDHNSTAGDIEFRGGGEPSQGPMPGLSDANRVTLRDVQVERAEGDTFWVRDGGESVAVVTVGGTPTVRVGQRVDLSGTYEQTDGGRRIRATRIDVK